MKKNPLLFPLLMCAIVATMYCIAFHNERDKVEELKEKIFKIQIKNNDI